MIRVGIGAQSALHTLSASSMSEAQRTLLPESILFTQHLLSLHHNNRQNHHVLASYKTPSFINKNPLQITTISMAGNLSRIPTLIVTSVIIFTSPDDHLD